MALVGGIPKSVMPNTRVKGFDIVLARLNREIKAIENRSEKGLVMAMAHIRNETESSEPITPLDLGNLRSSWFTVSATGKIANDSFNKGFKDNPKTGLKKSNLASDHASTIAEAKGIVSANTAAKGPLVMGGYSANYALWVHEKIGAVKWKRPGSGPKWFEIAVSRNTKKIVDIIKENVQIR